MWRAPREKTERGWQQRPRRKTKFFQLGLLQPFRLRPAVLEPDFDLKETELLVILVLNWLGSLKLRQSGCYMRLIMFYSYWRDSRVLLF